jgi:hypothetical protein
VTDQWHVAISSASRVFWLDFQPSLSVGRRLASGGKPVEKRLIGLGAVKGIVRLSEKAVSFST